MGVLGMFRAGAASSHGAWILCPSRPQHGTARSQFRRWLYSVSTSALSARCALPAHPDAASSSYSALPSSQPQALALYLSKYLSAGTRHVRWRDLVIIPYFILCSSGATQHPASSCKGRLYLRSIRPSHHQDMPVEPAQRNSHSDTHTYFSRFALRAFREMYPSDM